MPTRGRQKWAAEAVEMFLRQNYRNKQLIIVDDLNDPSFPNGLSYSNVRHSLASPKLTIGEKRNIAIQLSDGEIICHWDSDDIYSSDRISHQVDLLLEHGTELVGYNEMLFEGELGERWLYHGSPDYVIGVSLCYFRSSWARAPFPHLEDGEDNDFVKNHRRTLFCCQAGERIIARVHGDNTSPKRQKIRENPVQWEPVSDMLSK